MPLIVAMRRRQWAATTKIHILALVTAPEDAIYTIIASDVAALTHRGAGRP
jgi:hypothetical protein